MKNINSLIVFPQTLYKLYYKSYKTGDEPLSENIKKNLKESFQPQCWYKSECPNSGIYSAGLQTNDSD